MHHAPFSPWRSSRPTGIATRSLLTYAGREGRRRTGGAARFGAFLSQYRFGCDRHRARRISAEIFRLQCGTAPAGRQAGRLLILESPSSAGHRSSVILSFSVPCPRTHYIRLVLGNLCSRAAFAAAREASRLLSHESRRRGSAATDFLARGLSLLAPRVEARATPPFSYLRVT